MQQKRNKYRKNWSHYFVKLAKYACIMNFIKIKLFFGFRMNR